MKKANKFETIKDAVDAMFNALRDQFMPAEGKVLRIGYSTLGELYEQAVRASGGVPDPDTKQSLNEIADTYLDAAQSRMEANLKHVLTAVKHSKKEDKQIDTQSAIDEVVEKATTEVERIVDTESQRARAVGTWEGVSQAAAQMNIDDPTVFFVVVRDESLCDECKRLHLLPNEITPRVWKLSEVAHEYHERGNEYPTIQGLHPHCRCTKTILFPGFGFDSSGMVHWKGPDWDEFKSQRP